MKFHNKTPVGASNTIIIKSKYYTEYRKWCDYNNKSAVSNEIFGKRVLALGYRVGGIVNLPLFSTLIKAWIALVFMICKALGWHNSSAILILRLLFSSVNTDNNKSAVSNEIFGKRVLALGYRAERYSFGKARHTYYTAPKFNNIESRDIYNRYLDLNNGKT
mgnify:CR=1 FL=1